MSIQAELLPLLPLARTPLLALSVSMLTGLFGPMAPYMALLQARPRCLQTTFFNVHIALLHQGPAGNHSSVFTCWVGVSAKLRLVLAICVWYVVCLSLSCLAVPAMLLKLRVG